MIEELAPFGTPATTVTGSVYEDELPLLEFYTEECQGFRATLEKNDCKRHLVAVWRGGTHTGLLLEATNLLRCITAFSSVDLPTLARPVGGLG